MPQAPIRYAFRCVALIASLSVAACAVGPGPIEQQVSQSAGLCQQTGDATACGQWRNLAPLVEGERAQRVAQNNATAGAIAVGLLGIAAGAAIGAASAPHHHHYGHHHRHWR